MTGWGDTGDGFGSYVLNMVDVTVVPRQECGEDTVFCTATTHGKGSCYVRSLLLSTESQPESSAIT